MRQESNHESQSDLQTANNNNAVSSNSDAEKQSAFEYLKSLPPNFDRSVLDSYKIGRTSDIIDYEIAEDFTDSFRGVTEPFTIPVSWTMTKSALVKLLGITSYEDYPEVNGIRFYAGLNPDKQLTLIAVSTKVGTGCNDDLTVNERYPYYDYADPCPNNCSSIGNLKIKSGTAAAIRVVIANGNNSVG